MLAEDRDEAHNVSAFASPGIRAAKIEAAAVVEINVRDKGIR